MTAPSEKAMTVEEIALRLWNDIREGIGSASHIVQALTAAREEGRKEGFEQWMKINEVDRDYILSTVHRIRLKKSEEEGWNSAIEAAAKVCEQNDEVTQLWNGKRRVEKKTSNNVNGMAYAESIRSFKRPEEGR